MRSLLRATRTHEQRPLVRAQTLLSAGNGKILLRQVSTRSRFDTGIPLTGLVFFIRPVEDLFRHFEVVASSGIQIR